MEGLLFPATYRVSNADSERQVITRMAEQMERVGAQEDIETRPDGRERPRTAVRDLDDRLDDRAGGQDRGATGR